MENYRIDKELARGGLRRVLEASDKKTGEKVAIKELVSKDNELTPYILRECSILVDMNHPNIVRLRKVLTSRDKVYVVMDFVRRNLGQYKKFMPFPDENDVKLFLKMLLSGISYCHRSNIVHRDLKPKNLLIDDSTHPFTLKISDFGLARLITPSELSPGVGTLPYMAPEILLGSRDYDWRADMWSIGCIMAEMAKWTAWKSGAIFQGTNRERMLKSIFSVLGTPSEQSWPGVTALPRWNAKFLSCPAVDLERFLPQLTHDGVHLLQQLLCLNPTGRISAEAALQHPYLSGV